jgi:hypothetical protein
MIIEGDDDELHVDVSSHDRPDSNPNSPTEVESATGQGNNNGGNKRFRTQLAPYQVSC